MKIILARHATMVVCTGKSRILVDPMLSPAGSMPTVENSANALRNPLVDLPVSVNVLLDVDAVLLTHTHRDHFDDEAARLIPRNMPVFCQPEDEEKLRALGFKNYFTVPLSCDWNGITLIRTGGQHGTGKTGKMMGPVSGYVLQAENEPVLYIAGDTVWCAEVEEALKSFRPRVTVVNAGAARFNVGDPITMTAENIVSLCRACPETRVVAVHMEAFNHCSLTRDDLRLKMKKEGLSDRVTIPRDGDLTVF